MQQSRKDSAGFLQAETHLPVQANEDANQFMLLVQYMRVQSSTRCLLMAKSLTV